MTKLRDKTWGGIVRVRVRVKLRVRVRFRVRKGSGLGLRLRGVEILLNRSAESPLLYDKTWGGVVRVRVGVRVRVRV
jgi:hypothetical protein